MLLATFVDVQLFAGVAGDVANVAVVLVWHFLPFDLLDLFQMLLAPEVCLHGLNGVEGDIARSAK